jgi:hypothetical protein
MRQLELTGALHAELRGGCGAARRARPLHHSYAQPEPRKPFTGNLTAPAYASRTPLPAPAHQASSAQVIAALEADPEAQPHLDCRPALSAGARLLLWHKQVRLGRGGLMGLWSWGTAHPLGSMPQRETRGMPMTRESSPRGRNTFASTVSPLCIYRHGTPFVRVATVRPPHPLSSSPQSRLA